MLRASLSAEVRLICEISMRREVSETRDASWVPIKESWLETWELMALMACTTSAFEDRDAF